MATAFLIGRIIVGLYFISSGIRHFTHLKMMAGYAGSKGVPMPQIGVPVSGLLLLLGGLIYSLGVPVHLWQRLSYHNAIWHGFVLIAAGCHYTAVVVGVVLAA